MGIEKGRPRAIGWDSRRNVKKGGLVSGVGIEDLWGCGYPLAGHVHTQREPVYEGHGGGLPLYHQSAEGQSPSKRDLWPTGSPDR
jgi:hypothetical protein